MTLKEDVVSWFKELESYKRIDTMCTLLNMCLPFELRFLGTVLEELGRRDSQELRGIELRVNNTPELAADIASCQTGEPTDIKVRRKMAMFLALIRSCSRQCVNELFKTLDGWGERDFTKFGDGDTFQELLLVYTMASNHPVFSFEQRSKCGEIFSRVNETNNASNLTSSYQQEIPSTTMHQLQQHHQQHQQHSSSSSSPHQQLISNTPPLQQQQQSQTLPQQPQQQQQQTHLQPSHILTQPTHLRYMDINFPAAQISQIIPIDGNLSQHVAIDPINQMPVLPAEFAVPHPWNMRHNIQQLTPTQSIDPLHYTIPQQSSSPMMSQPASPSLSRSGSPSRMASSASNIHQQQQQQQQPPQQQQQHRNNSIQQQRNVRSARRPSVDTTPPPQQQQTVGVVGPNEMIMQPQNTKYDDISCINIDPLTLTHQLHSLRNGYTRHHTLPRHSKHASHIQQHLHQQQHQQQQQQHQQQQQQFQTNQQTSINPSNIYEIQNMSLMEQVVENNTGHTHKKSVGSDSGSSTGSLGEISPPVTPNTTTRGSYQTYKHMNRLNGGRTDKMSTSGTIVFQQGGGGTSQQQQQMNQNFMPTNEMIVAATNMLTNNNNCNSGNGSNNNFVTTGVMMAAAPSIVSPSSAGGCSTTLVGNPIMLQQAPQQLTATYPYHHTQQHLATSSRPHLLSHPSQLPPPSVAGAYRHHDVIYPYQLPSGHAVAFIAQSQPSLRSSPSSIQPPPSIIQTVAPFGVPSQQHSNKLSCFNCGAQSHSGRECQDPSMEDVTRNSIYKLDFSASSASSPTQSTSIHSDTQLVNDTQASLQQLSSIPSNNSSK